MKTPTTRADQVRPIRSVAVVFHPEKPRAAREMPRIRAWLKARGIVPLKASEMARADAVVVFGGDGTILSVAPQAAKIGIPVLGVNIGRLGFVTAVDVDEVYRALKDWLTDGWVTSRRLMLAVTAPRVKAPLYALNDAVLRAGATTGVTTIHARVDGKVLAQFVGDGVIVATSTGSTAYSLAAQGPVVHPEVDAVILTPICPHSFMQRPVVFPSRCRVELTVEDGRRDHRVQLALDGRRVIPIRPGETVVVHPSPFKLELLTRPETSFFNVLREKLSWGGR